MDNNSNIPPGWAMPDDQANRVNEMLNKKSIPPEGESEKYIKKESNGCCRHYLRGYFPLQMSFLETDRSEGKPVNIYAGDVIH